MISPITALNQKLDRKKDKCQKYFYSQAKKIFFWGHPLSEIYRHDIFRKLPTYTESLGFCFISAALTMFALRDNPSARLRQINSKLDDGSIIKHGWTEFKYSGQWWAADFVYLDHENSPEYRFVHKYIISHRKKWTCSYNSFWSHPTTIALKPFFDRPETSHIFGELYAYAGCQRKGGIEFSENLIKAVSSSKRGRVLPGRYPTYVIPDGNPLHPICRTAIDGLLLSKNGVLPKSDLKKIEDVMRVKDTHCQ